MGIGALLRLMLPDALWDLTKGIIEAMTMTAAVGVAQKLRTGELDWWILGTVFVVAALVFLIDRWVKKPHDPSFLRRFFLWIRGAKGPRLTLKIGCRGYAESRYVKGRVEPLDVLHSPMLMVSFFRVENVSSHAQGRAATGVEASLLFYDKDWTPITRAVKGVWQSERGEWYNQTVLYLSAAAVNIGDRDFKELTVLMQYKGEETSYGVGDESCCYREWRNPEMELGEQSQIYVRVTLQGNDMRQESYWIMGRDDKSGVWGGQNISPPVGMM